MLRIFLILSLAVALAGVAFSFVLKDKVGALTEQRNTFKDEKEKAMADAAASKNAEKKAKDGEKKAKDELDSTKTELTAATTRLTEVEATLTKAAKDLESTRVDRDTAQQALAKWNAIGVKVDQVVALKTESQRIVAERDVLVEEKKVMNREILRLNDKLGVYEGKAGEVAMKDIKGKVISVDGNYQYVVLDIGSEAGLRQNGKMIITRGENLIGKVQLVKVEARTAIANLLPDWTKGSVQKDDVVMTSYEALAK